MTRAQARDLLANSKPGAARKSMQEKLEHMEMLWNPLLQATKDRRALLSKTIELDKQWQKARQTADSNLTETERAAQAATEAVVEPDCESLIRRKQQLQQQKADVGQRHTEVDSAANLADQLLSCAPADQQPVNQSVDQLKARTQQLDKQSVNPHFRYFLL